MEHRPETAPDCTPAKAYHAPTLVRYGHVSRLTRYTPEPGGSEDEAYRRWLKNQNCGNFNPVE